MVSLPQSWPVSYPHRLPLSTLSGLGSPQNKAGLPPLPAPCLDRHCPGFPVPTHLHDRHWGTPAQGAWSLVVPHSLGSSRNSLCSCPCPALGPGLRVEPCSSRVQWALSLASHPARPGRRWPPAVPMVRAALLVASDLTQSQTTLGAGRRYVPMLPGVRGHRPRTRGAQAAPRADPVLATSPLTAGTGEPGALPEAGEALSRARPRPALCLCLLGQGRHLRPPAHGSSSTRGPPRTPAGLTDRRVALRTSPCGGEGRGRAQPWVPWV